MSEVTGINEVIKNLRDLEGFAGKEVAQALFKGGQAVRNTAVRSIQTVSQGQRVKRYRAGGNSYQHVASKKGDAPNTDTGRLVNSVAVEVNQLNVFVGSSLGYAKELEFAVDRPWLMPALEKNKKLIAKLVADAMKATTNRKPKR